MSLGFEVNGDGFTPIPDEQGIKIGRTSLLAYFDMVEAAKDKVADSYRKFDERAEKLEAFYRSLPQEVIDSLSEEERARIQVYVHDEASELSYQ